MSLEKFFFKLAERSNENYLSDITWALLETVPKFRENFLKFFDFEFDEPIEVQREYKIEGTDFRVDFCITSGRKKFLIEIKYTIAIIM